MASRKHMDSDPDFPEALTFLLISFIVCKSSMQGLIVGVGWYNVCRKHSLDADTQHLFCTSSCSFSLLKLNFQKAFLGLIHPQNCVWNHFLIRWKRTNIRNYVTRFLLSHHHLINRFYSHWYFLLKKRMFFIKKDFLAIEKSIRRCN